MKFVIFGASGLIGGDLSRSLQAVGETVVPVTTSKKKPGARWNPDKGELNPRTLEDADVVINLAGASIAGKRWSDKYKQEIRDSRVRGSELIAKTLNNVRGKDCTFISVSGIGLYGDSPGVIHTEKSAAGEGFLADVATEWEAASNLAECRVVIPRLGMVLSPLGGALAKILPIFSLHLGGIVGDGKQIWSWISLRDVTNAILFLIAKDTASGAYNFAAPVSTTNAEFTRKLAEALGKTAKFPLPAFIAKLVMGEMADELLLASVDAHPTKLLEDGYRFKDPDLKTLKRIIGEPT